MDIVSVLTQFGGLGVIAVFAWALLQFTLKQQEKLANLLSNHLVKLLDRQEKTNAVLDELCKGMKELNRQFAEYTKEWQNYTQGRGK